MRPYHCPQPGLGRARADMRVDSCSALSVAHIGTTDEGRHRYRLTIQFPVEGQMVVHTDETLYSGVGSPVDADAMLATSVVFLLAFIEAMPGSENYDLFPEWVREWAEEHEVDLSLQATLVSPL